MTTTKHSQSWLEKISELLTREPKNKDELVDLIRDAANRQLITTDVLLMLEGIFNFANQKVSEIMINRNQMVSINIQNSFTEIIDTLIESKHSRIPCFNESNNEIIGILHAKDILPFMAKTQQTELLNILRPANFIPQNKRVDLLLTDFKNSRNHMAIILDEYRSVVGLVTIEDVLEQIVGDIIDEFETE